MTLYEAFTDELDKLAFDKEALIGRILGKAAQKAKAAKPKILPLLAKPKMMVAPAAAAVAGPKMALGRKFPKSRT